VTFPWLLGLAILQATVFTAGAVWRAFHPGSAPGRRDWISVVILLMFLSGFGIWSHHDSQRQQQEQNRRGEFMGLIGNEISKRLGAELISFDTIRFGFEPDDSSGTVIFTGLREKNEPIEGRFVLVNQGGGDWLIRGTDRLANLKFSMHLSAQRAEQPLLRVTLRVLEVPATFDDAQLLRPSGLLDSGEVKILAAPYVVIPSGNEGTINLPPNKGVGAGFSPVLSGRTQTLYVKPTLEPGTAHVRYTLDGLVRGVGDASHSLVRQSICSDSLQLGELQLKESNGLPNGHRQLALISVEMEVMKVDSSGKTVPTDENSFAPNLPASGFIRHSGTYQLSGGGELALTPSSDGRVSFAFTRAEGSGHDIFSILDFFKQDGWFVYVDSAARVWIFDGVRQLDVVAPDGRYSAGADGVRALCPATVWDAVPESVRKSYRETQNSGDSQAAREPQKAAFGPVVERVLTGDTSLPPTFLNMKEGVLVFPPEKSRGLSAKTFADWWKGSRADFMVVVMEKKHLLVTLETGGAKFIPIPGDKWDNITTDELADSVTGELRCKRSARAA
jgi:hypothetical protein